MTAGEAWDEDIEHGDNAGNDGCQNGSNAVDNGHEAATDGAEDGFDLLRISLLVLIRRRHYQEWKGFKRTQDTIAPIVDECSAFW
jgi:hypothetical protein